MIEEEKAARKMLIKWDTCSQFHQHFKYKFFIQMLFWQLFASYMYIEKAAEATFVQTICL